jgi:hypothetical protein
MKIKKLPMQFGIGSERGIFVLNKKIQGLELQIINNANTQRK